MIRFEADSAKIAECGVFVSGRVHQGTIRIGSVFAWVDEMSTDFPRFQFRVEGIVAYGHSLEELPEGMTGELHLTGDHIDTLMHMNGLFTCIGLE